MGSVAVGTLSPQPLVLCPACLLLDGVCSMLTLLFAVIEAQRLHVRCRSLGGASSRLAGSDLEAQLAAAVQRRAGQLQQQEAAGTGAAEHAGQLAAGNTDALPVAAVHGGQSGQAARMSCAVQPQEGGASPGSRVGRPAPPAPPPPPRPPGRSLKQLCTAVMCSGQAHAGCPERELMPPLHDRGHQAGACWSEGGVSLWSSEAMNRHTANRGGPRYLTP